MGKVIFTIITIFLFLYVNKRLKGTWLLPSSFLIFIYLLSTICAFFDIKYNDITLILDEKYVLSAIAFVVFVVAFLYPFCSFREDKIHFFLLPNQKVLNVFSGIIIILSLYAIIYFGLGVKNVFSYGDLDAARNDRYAFNVSHVETGLLYTIGSVSASFYAVAIFLFFIYTAIGGCRKRCILLFFSSFSEPVHILTSVGRDGIVFWIFSFLFFFLLFIKFLPENKVRYIRKMFIYSSVVALIPFMLISISRFHGNVIGDLVSYMGQSFRNFCYYLDIEDRPVSYGSAFPLYYEITGKVKPIVEQWSAGGTYSSAFATFIRSFFVNFGIGGTIVVCFFMGIIFRIIIKIKIIRMPFYCLFIYMLYFQIYSQGVFYFRQYTRGGNLFIILCFLFYFLFHYIQKRDLNPLILRKLR